MANNLVRVKDAGAFKLRKVEVDDVMVRFC